MHALDPEDRDVGGRDESHPEYVHNNEFTA